MEQIVLSIEERTYPRVKEGTTGNSASDLEYVQFGEAYAGRFVFKPITLGDQLKIHALSHNTLVKAGFASAVEAGPVFQEQEFAFAAVALFATEKPEWFDKEKLGTFIDQFAVIEVGRALSEAMQLKKN